MKLKTVVGVGSMAVIFLFLPSLAIKAWEFLVAAPWPVKRWLVYFLVGVILVRIAMARYRRKKQLRLEQPAATSLLEIAKERLVRGEISLDEFRAIKEELRAGM